MAPKHTRDRPHGRCPMRGATPSNAPTALTDGAAHQRSSAPSVRAGGAVNALARAKSTSVRPDVGCCRFGIVVGFVPAEANVSVMPAPPADDLLHVIVALVENESLLPYDSASTLARPGAAPH